MPINTASARVVDPVLTNIAQGYAQGQFVGSFLFPRVPVGQRGGQIIEFDKTAFQRYATKRAPGSKTARIEFGYAGKKFALTQDALDGKVPREHLEEAAQQSGGMPGINLGQVAVSTVMSNLLMSLEIEQAETALNAAAYDTNHKVALAGATKWSASTGTPLVDISTAVQTIRRSCGVKANVVLMSSDAYLACRENPTVVSRFVSNANVPLDATQITPQMLAGLFGVEKVVIGEGIYFDDTGTSVDIWGNNVVVAYVPNQLGTMTNALPSYGYTYTLNGNPLVEATYWDQREKSWVYPVTFERAPVLSGIAAGYLIQNPA